MKATLTTLLFFLCFTATKAQQFKISYDTISVNLKGSLRKAIFFKDKYYCLTEIKSSDWDFYILSKEGKVIDNIALLNEMKVLNLSLYHVNDTIIIRTDDDKVFYLDEVKKEWHKFETPYDLIYEDDKYQVNYIDYGEFGENLWFLNKKTNVEREVATNTSYMIRNKDAYYLISGYIILVIEDPEKLMPVDPETSYKIVKEKNQIYQVRTIQGLKKIYQGRENSFEKVPYIAKTFIYNENLYHIMIDEEDKSMTITTITEEKMETLQHLAFKDVDETAKGIYEIIEVEGDNINFHHFKQ